MKELKKRKKILIAFGIFLLLMFLGFIISKGIYASGLPQVSTTTPIKSSIVHTVEVEGSVKQGKESARNTLSGLRVENIYVRVGDIVNPEDVLFDVDMEDLNEQITSKEREIKKLELQIADIQQNNLLEAQRKETQLTRANEDYTSTENAANRGITNADEAVSDAQENLRKHEANPVQLTSLEEREKKEQEYAVWIQQKATLEVSLLTLQEEKKAAEEAVLQAQTALGEAEQNGEPEEVLQPLREALQQAEEALLEKETACTEAQSAIDAHMANPIEKPDYSGEDAAKESWEEKKAQLEDVLEDAQKRKGEAELDKADVMTDAKRSVEDAGWETEADSTLEIYQLTLEEEKEKLKKYTAIRDKEGKIFAENTGIITVVNVAVGERTLDSPVVKFADLSQNLDFTAFVNEEQKKYVNIGDSAKIQWFDSGGKKEDVVIDYLWESESMPSNYEITAILPKESGIIGQSGVLSLSVDSERYDCCVPLDALHTDGNGRKFVYIMSRKESILGTELAVRTVFVTVLDQNEKYVALECELLNSETEIVVSSTKEIEDGTVVRYLEW